MLDRLPDGRPKGNFTPEQEAAWAKEKTECLARHDARIIEQGVAWLLECKHSPETRARRIEAIRKKYRDRLVKLIVEKLG